MAEADSNAPDDPPIHVDEDWKERVEIEDAVLDEKLRKEQKSEPPVAEPADQAPLETKTESAQPQPRSQPLPKADFGMLIGIFSGQAMASLGLIPGPEGNTNVDLHIAKHFVDLLGLIEEKTAGNLDDQEKTFLESTLHQLRMVYLEVSKGQETKEQKDERPDV